MKRSLYVVILVIGFFGTTLATELPWRSYEVYQPEIDRCYVVNSQSQDLQYNHCVTIAWFKNRWFCLWNASTKPKEGAGHLIYMSTSKDAKLWSEPELAFSSQKRNINPVPLPRQVQWQPGSIVVNDELWVFWSQYSMLNGKKDDTYGAYFSKLSDPDGKWENRRLLWNGNPDVEIDGVLYRVFPSQNPVLLSTGRVLVPVILMSPLIDGRPKGIPQTNKFSSVVYSDDNGQTWKFSVGTKQSIRPWAQWEPTVWEQPDGSVAMVARNWSGVKTPDKGGPKWTEMLLRSQSFVGGETWSPHEYVPIETVGSRMHVVRTDWDFSTRPGWNERIIMVHNDSRHRVPSPTTGRNPLALFFTRGGGFDFVTGNSITGDELVVHYPHMWIKDNTLYVGYTHGVGRSDIKVAQITPLPDQDKYYIFPRGRVYPDSHAPEKKYNWYHFHNRNQYIDSKKPIHLDPKGFSGGAWFRVTSGQGILLEARGPNKEAALVWTLARDVRTNGRQFLELPGMRLSMDGKWRRFTEWTYLGYTVDLNAGEVVFYVDGREELRQKFDPKKINIIPGTSVRIGHSQFSEDADRNFIIDGTFGKIFLGDADRNFGGDIRFIGLYNELLGPEEHLWIYNRHAFELARIDGVSPKKGSSPKSKAILMFDPASPLFASNFLIPKPSRSGTIETDEVDGKKVLRFFGDISAGLDLDYNNRQEGDQVELAFSFKLEEGDEHVLCTIGDGNAPARLIHRNQKIFLAADDQEVLCGSMNPGKWNKVDVITQGEMTKASVNSGDYVAVKHEPEISLVFLGQGYRVTKFSSDESPFLISIDSVHTKVKHIGKKKPSIDD